MSSSDSRWLDDLIPSNYPYGFTTDISIEKAPEGLSEATIRFISAKKEEPAWLLDLRLKALAYWQTLTPPTWANLTMPPIDEQKITYYAAPKGPRYQSLDEVDPEVLATFERLGVPLEEQKRLAGVAVDAVLDSVSVGTTFQATLEEKGILFCSFSEAVQRYPQLVQAYLGKVVPYRDNYYAALNAAVFSDGSFCYIPQGVRCPMELSTYFRINAANTGQFERTLIVAEEGSYVSYLEGCTAPIREEHQLHAAVVEIHVAAHAEVRYATIQNWYPGDVKGKGGILNVVTKRALCAGKEAKMSWTQLETGSAVTWKYPSCVLKGDRSVGEFYSVAVTKNKQQADTGTKMIHIGKGTRSSIISKGISAGEGRNTYRGLVQMAPQAIGANNFSQCDSLLLGDRCSAYTYPYIEGRNATSQVEHEATVARMEEEMLFYCQQRGLSEEQAHALVATGFCQEVLAKLPMEFAVEGKKLLEITLEGSIG